MPQCLVGHESICSASWCVNDMLDFDREDRRIKVWYGGNLDQPGESCKDNILLSLCYPLKIFVSHSGGDLIMGMLLWK